MDMRDNTTDLMHLFVSDVQHFTYKISPYSLTNFLGTQVAVLREYCIENNTGEIYQLYKTEDGNWYDITEETVSEKIQILHSLKMAIESKEKAIG